MTSMIGSTSSSGNLLCRNGINARTKKILTHVKSRLRLSRRTKVLPSDPGDSLSTPSDLRLWAVASRQDTSQRASSTDEDTSTSSTSKDVEVGDSLDKYWESLSGDFEPRKDHAKSGPLQPRPSLLHKTSKRTSPKKKKNVSFSSSMEVRSYPPVLGDNPCCSGGMALECDWQPQNTTEVDLEVHEKARATTHRRRSTGQLQLSWAQRKNRLVQSMGLTTVELIRLECSLARARESFCDGSDGCYW